MKENLLENSENGDRLEYILSKKIGYGPGQ